MTPVNMLDIIPKTAERLGVKESDLRLIIEKFYKNLKQVVRRIGYVQITIPDLGYFYFRHYEADKELIQYKRALRQLEESNDFASKQIRINFYKELIEDVTNGIEMGRLHDARRRFYFVQGKEKHFNSLKEVKNESNKDT